ncbi:cytochrome P450 6k1-like isoform X2 [Bacillus rossius redtenbacheri]
MGVFSGSLLLLLATLAAYVYVSFKRKYKYWERKGVAHVPPPSFLFGNTRDFTLMRRGIAGVLADIYKAAEGEPFVGLFQSRQPLLLARDPQFVRRVLVADFAHFADRDVDVDERDNPVDSTNLIFLKGERWRALKMRITPTLSASKVRGMFATMAECASNMADGLRGPAAAGGSVEMRDVAGNYTTDIIGTCAFGLAIDSVRNPDSEFRRMGRKVFATTLGLVLRRLTIINYPAVGRLLRLSYFNTEVTGFFRRVVRDMVEHRQRNGVSRDDFLQQLIRLKRDGIVLEDRSADEDDEGLMQQLRDAGTGKEDKVFEITDDLLAAQCFVFFTAGYETSSATMGFCLYELALNPRVQERLRSEVDAALSAATAGSTRDDGGCAITRECVQRMEYMDAVVHETLRKYPPVAVLTRGCTLPYNLPGASEPIEKGVRLFVSVYGIHHDPKYYPDPEKFDPERFLHQNKHRTRSPAYLPFGVGPRMCLGSRFGLLQIKVGLAALLSKYQFDTATDTEIPLQLNPKSFILTPKNGVKLKISSRK